MIRKIVACIGLVIVVVGTVMWLTPSKSCESGSKGAREVCQLQGKQATIYEDGYVDGSRRAGGK
jgi:hypothetical protein